MKRSAGAVEWIHSAEKRGKSRKMSKRPGQEAGLEAAAATKKPRKSLSTKTMGMKFMVRREEAKQADRAKREEQQRMEAAHWVVKRNDNGASSSKLVCIPDPTVSRPTTVGRRSFGSFNKAVEETAKAIRDDKILHHEDPEAGEEVDEGEMVERMQTLTGLPMSKRGSVQVQVKNRGKKRKKQAGRRY